VLVEMQVGQSDVVWRYLLFALDLHEIGESVGVLFLLVVDSPAVAEDGVLVGTVFILEQADISFKQHLLASKVLFSLWRQS
jgi:hypothetical protein